MLAETVERLVARFEDEEEGDLWQDGDEDSWDDDLNEDEGDEWDDLDEEDEFDDDWGSDEEEE